MSFFDQVYSQLFPKKSRPHEIMVHEPIHRSAQYSQKYIMWTKSFDRIELINKVYNSYILKKQGVTGDPDVHILSSNSSNGFAISWNSNLGKSEFTYLFDWMCDKVLELDYKKSNSDTTITDKGNIVETVSKHYLKPQNKLNSAGPIDQKFGNVLIELILTNDQPSYLKFVANTYNDHQYNKALGFEKLAEFLFDKS